jgi:hypothetical protein
MRLIAALAASVVVSLAFADGAHAYRLCDNPARSYRVVSVEKVSCRYAKLMADEYNRRFMQAFDEPGEYGPVPSNVWGWRRVATKNGMYWGLFGARTVFRRGDAKIRIDSRGE